MVWLTDMSGPRSTRLNCILQACTAFARGQPRYKYPAPLLHNISTSDTTLLQLYYMADTTYIDYNTPASGKSEYFDAPIMHIFSKPAEEEDVALSPTTPGRIRTTTSLNSGWIGSGGQDDGVVENAGQSSDEEHGVPDLDDVTSRDYAVVTHKRVGSTSTGGAGSDSGYDSPSRRNKPRELRDDDNDIQPIPVAWAEPGTDAVQRGPKSLASTADARRSQSMRSFHTVGTLNRDGGSIRTTVSGRYTPADRRRRASLTGGTFSNGAGTVGPAAAANEEDTNLFRSRSVSAESALSKKQMLKISKTERECHVVLRAVKGN